LAGGGPDERSICAVGVVAVGVAPGVDEVCVGISRAANHRRFGFEVTFCGWGAVVLVGAEEIGEENCASVGVGRSSGSKTCRWIGHRVGGGGVRIVIGVVAIAGGLEGGDFGFCGGGGTVTADGSGGTEGEACENADDGDDGKEFDEGERRRRAARG